MRIICPSCSNHYEVDPDGIGAEGQLVRCTHCREVWRARHPKPASATIDAAPFVARDPSRLVDFARARVRLRPRPALQGAEGRGSLRVLGLAGAVLCAVAALLGGRETVVRQAPALGPVYAALGLPVNVLGLALRDVRGSLVAEGDRTVLVLQGTISNLRDGATPVPTLALAVRDGASAPLYIWTAPPPKASLAARETVAFRSRLTAPPIAGRDVRVSFAEAFGS